MRDGLGIALACNDLDWTRVWQVARRNCTVGRMVGVAAIGDAWLYGTPRWVLAQTWQEACDRLETTVMRPSGTRENNKKNILFLVPYRTLILPIMVGLHETMAVTDLIRGDQF
jgi:hypothetical protein